MGLAPANAYFDVMRKAGLVLSVMSLTSRYLPTHPHGRMQRSCYFVILIEPWAAPKDFRKPVLADCALHMCNLALGWSWRPNPLRWFSTHTAYHVGMCESFGSSLTWFDIESGGDGLCDT